MAACDITLPPFLRDRKARSAVPTRLVDLLEAGWNDLGFHCKQWFPRRFRRPYNELNQQIIDAVNEIQRDQRRLQAAGRPCGVKVVVIGTRGCSKTTLVSFGLASRNLMYGLTPYDIHIGAALPRARRRTEELRRQIFGNPEIKAAFGSLRATSLDKDLQEVFGRDAWVMETGGRFPSAMVMPVGIGMPIRGELYNDYRPLNLYGDDLDDDKKLLNPDQRDYVYNTWFEGAVRYCVDLDESECAPYSIFILDSCKHGDSLAERCARDPGFTVIRISVCDDAYRTLAPSFMSQASLDREIAQARAKGTLDSLARELMSKPASPEGNPFSPAYWQYWTDSRPTFEALTAMGTKIRLADFSPTNPDLFTCVLGDPARTVSPTSCPSALVGVTVDLASPGVYVREIFNERVMPDDFTRAAVDMAKRIGAHAIGIEFAGLHLHLSTDFKLAMEHAGLWDIALEDLKPAAGRGPTAGYEKGKASRIAWGLSNFYRNRLVYHHPTACAVLESQLMSFTTAPFKDVADAFAYLPQLMETLGIEFDSLLPEAPPDPSTPIDLWGSSPDFSLETPEELAELYNFSEI